MRHFVEDNGDGIFGRAEIAAPPAKIYEIELYGYQSATAARPKEPEDQREAQLDQLLQ